MPRVLSPLWRRQHSSFRKSSTQNDDCYITPLFIQFKTIDADPLPYLPDASSWHRRTEDINNAFLLMNYLSPRVSNGYPDLNALQWPI
jgi:hypothetical protein